MSLSLLSQLLLGNDLHPVGIRAVVADGCVPFSATHDTFAKAPGGITGVTVESSAGGAIRREARWQEGARSDECVPTDKDPVSVRLGQDRIDDISGNFVLYQSVRARFIALSDGDDRGDRPLGRA